MQNGTELEGRMCRMENAIATQVEATNNVRIEVQSLKSLLHDVKNGIVAMTAAHVELTGKVDDISSDNNANAGSGGGSGSTAMIGTVRLSAATGLCNN